MSSGRPVEMKTTAAASQPSGLCLRVQLMLIDDATKKLKRSRRHGELRIDMDEQCANLVYPRHGTILRRRTFPQPKKCLLRKRTLRVYSSNGTRTFMYVCALRIDMATLDN